MTLKQLRFLREIARQSLNISAAAAALHTSQPGVSRQIQLLERELGVDLLLRRTNRILGFTDAGRAVLASAERLLGESDNIALIAADSRDESAGRLVLATSHLHACYTLPAPVHEFSRRHPAVQLHLLQAEPDDIQRLVESREADIGVSTELTHEHPELVQLPVGVMRRSLIMPAKHPLRDRPRISLADMAQYPMVSYHPRSRGGQIIASAFAEAGLTLRHVVSASDSDVIKAYVAEGLGIAVVPDIALGAGAGRSLHAVDVTRLFACSQTTLSLRRGTHLRRYLTDFIRMVVPGYDRAAVERAMRRAG
ncbi:MAG: LysR family transcriptional regulator [Burkholderiales bacterium]|nr:LysR family transcriptional regulator [Burkholderiales bacterium]